MKVILIILLILFLAITSLFGITIINRNKDIDYEDESSLAAEEKIEDGKTTAPDSEVKTIDDAEGISKPDMDNIGADYEERMETEDGQTDLSSGDEATLETQQNGEEETEDEESEETAEEEEDGEAEEEAEEEEEIIEDNTVRVFLDGDMENGIYLGETTCGKESTEAYNLYGEEFKNTGFTFTWKNNDAGFLPGSTHYIYIYFYSTGSGWDYIREEAKLPGEKECERDIVIFVDKPQDKAITENLQQVNGWTVDLRNEESPGIEKIEIYLDGPKDYGKSIGVMEYGLLRYDVSEFLENLNYLRSGFSYDEPIDLEPGSKHTLFIYSYSSIDNSFNYEKREIYLSGKKEEKAVIKARIDQEKLSRDGIIEITGWAADKKLIDEYLKEKRASEDETFESEDGYSIKKVVFTSNRDGNKNIYSINIDGTGITRLTSYSGSDFYPEASPDGSKITYASDIRGIWQIMVMDWDGKNKKQITHNSFRCGYPSWSFDGKYIYFEAYINGDWELYRIKGDGTGQKRLTFNSTYNDWHPNGHPFKYEIIYESGITGKENIYVMSHSGSGIRKIGGSGPRRRVPDVSNDGTKITYMRYSGNNSDIWIMDYSGQNETKLTSNPDWDGHPSFSPDDKYIIYDEIKGSREDLIIINLASGGKTNITNSSSIDEDPSFLYQ
jgi:Tol biopolymer transport system component